MSITGWLFKMSELVGLTRLERAASCTPCMRSSQLSYSPIGEIIGEGIKKIKSPGITGGFFGLRCLNHLQRWYPLLHVLHEERENVVRLPARLS